MHSLQREYPRVQVAVVYADPSEEAALPLGSQLGSQAHMHQAVVIAAATPRA